MTGTAGGNPPLAPDMPVAEEDLWSLTRGRPQIDPERLARAVEREVSSGALDFRTRLLIRDSVEALGRFWGDHRVQAWLARSPARSRLIELLRADLGPPGFPTLKERIVEATRPDVVLQFLREVGSHLKRPATLFIGGSAALIVLGKLSRHTEDIDVVDEVPEELRQEHDLLHRLAGRYGLHLAHFQSHYLPSGWKERVQSLGRFGILEVHVVDPHDIFLSKLFSPREKDLDDLRMLAPQFGRDVLAERLRRDAAALIGEERLARVAERNWYVVFGEPLPM